MRRRGHVLSLVAVVLAIGITAIAVFLTRFSVNDASRRGDRVRVQTLWLARSACWAGAGVRTVSTPSGAAEVTRAGTSVEVRLASARVELDCSSGVTRFSAAR